MSTALGNPSFPIRRGFVKQVLILLVNGAQQLRTENRVTPATREDSISNGLDRAMRILYKDSNSDIVNWSLRGVHTVPDAPSITFAPDFSFHGDWRPRNQAWYLGVEAKKLKGRGDSLAGDYVDEGVMRFVQGHYSRGHDYSVMLGYVVVPTVDVAISRVQSAMAARSLATQQVTSMTPNPEICPNDMTYTSIHRQIETAQCLNVIHLFLDFCQR